MPSIHIDTDLMRTLAGNFLSMNEQIQTLQTSAASQASTLENSWVGGSARASYDTLYQEWQAQVKTIILNGEDLGRHLQSTAAAFDTASNSAM